MASSPSEHEIQQRIRLACGLGPVRLWRNNSGALVDQQGRFVRFGLCKESSNLISHDHGLEQETSAPLILYSPDCRGGEGNQGEEQSFRSAWQGPEPHRRVEAVEASAFRFSSSARHIEHHQPHTQDRPRPLALLSPAVDSKVAEKIAWDRIRAWCPPGRIARHVGHADGMGMDGVEALGGPRFACLGGVSGDLEPGVAITLLATGRAAQNGGRKAHQGQLALTPGRPPDSSAARGPWPAINGTQAHPLAEAAVAAIISITIHLAFPSSCPWPSLSPDPLSP